MSLQEALNKADDIGLDLVEISPNTNPPVCKILDYGKYIYEKQKLDKKNKKKQHVIHVKEIRVRPNTGDHDLLTKLSRAKKFLEAGDKVKITVMYRGREMARQDAELPRRGGPGRPPCRTGGIRMGWLPHSCGT